MHGLCEEITQAWRNLMPLRQKHTSDHSGPTTGKLLSADRIADDHDDQPGARQQPNGREPDLNVSSASLKKGQVLLYAGPRNVLFEMYLETCLAKARSHQLFS